ncbi:hypothetical protein FACS189494_00280 [Spirochaetia bacterium]|nr:hypothetical protein FACS189494_00280 [Spirochaetia bacterium]
MIKQTMKLHNIIHLAIEYLKRYKRRYLFLFAALSFGFSIVTVITSQKEGMSRNVSVSSQGHYSGDMLIIFYDRGYNGPPTGSSPIQHIKKETIDIVKESIKEAKINPSVEKLRTVRFMGITLFYNGAAANLKYLVGMDWNNEKEYMGALGAEEYFSTDTLDDNTIIISSPIAKQLGIKTGDGILVEVENIHGQKDTANLIVGGIVNDDSVFGYYKSYISRTRLNKLIGFGEGDCSVIGLIFNSGYKIEEKMRQLQSVIEKKITFMPLSYTWDSFDDILYREYLDEGYKGFILTPDIFLKDVNTILQALNILTYFLYLMMLLIIFVSASVTYRLIIHERTKEIGTMRVIGFHESDVRLILIIETIVLASLSIVTGFALSLLFNWVLSYMSFSWMPGFSMFLKDGRLQALFDPIDTIVNVVAIYILLFAAIFIPVFTASRSPLPEMLSGSIKE